LLAPRNRQVTIAVYRSEIPRVKPALCQCFLCGGGLVPVAFHDVWTSRQYFAVRGDPDFHARQRWANGSWLVMTRAVEADDRRGLSQTVPRIKRQAGFVKGRLHGRRQGSTTACEPLDPSAKGGAQFGR